MKIYKALAALSIYLISVCIIYYLHVLYFRVDVVFYSALFDVLLASLVVLLALRFGCNFFPFNTFEKIQLFVICLLVGYILAISVPTVIDRSLSFYILEKIDQQEGGIRLDQFEKVFTIDYAREHRLVDVRLTEQLHSGTIVIENNCVKLTSRGEMLAAFSRFYRQNLLPKNRLLMGEYSDVLTNPLRESKINVEYMCR